MYSYNINCIWIITAQILVLNTIWKQNKTLYNFLIFFLFYDHYFVLLCFYLILLTIDSPLTSNLRLELPLSHCRRFCICDKVENCMHSREMRRRMRPGTHRDRSESDHYGRSLDRTLLCVAFLILSVYLLHLNRFLRLLSS